MRAFVTGATGTIGRVVTTRLLGAGWSLRVLVQRDSAHPIPANPRIEQQFGTLDDRLLIERMARGANVAIHLAGVLPGAREESLARVNVAGTATVAEACARAGVGRLVFVSSTSVYRDAADPFARGIAEDAPLLTEAVGQMQQYGLSKVEAERRILDLHRSGRLSFVIVRAPVVYGAADGWDDRVMQMVRQRPLITLARLPAAPTLQCVHVEDLAAGIVRAATAPAAANQVLNMAGPEVFSFRDVGARALAPEVASVVRRPAPAVPLKYDIRKAARVAGYAPRPRILNSAAAY